jgi:hypothetical protein
MAFSYFPDAIDARKQEPVSCREDRRPAHSFPQSAVRSVGAEIMGGKQKGPGALGYEQRQQQQVWTKVVT